jgi:hypothetical protein
MGLFNFFDTDPNEKIINEIYKYLISTDSFIYFSKDGEKNLIEYKRFETALLAAAIHKVILEKKVRGSLTDSDQQSIKKIYFKNTSNFYNTYIKSGELKLSILSSNNLNESRWILEIFVKFNKYVKDVSNILKSKKAYWVEDLDEPEYDEEFGIELTGQKIYHNFINNIFLSQIINEPEEIPYIKTIEVWSLTKEDFENLQKFVDKINELVLNLSR